MEMSEVIAVLDAIQMAYPKFAQSYSEDKMPKVASMWYQFFENEDATAVLTVLNEYIATNPFPPSVADIKGKLNRLDGYDKGALWDELEKAAMNAYGTTYEPVGDGKSRRVYYKDIEFQKLSAPLKRFVGSAEGLADFRKYIKEDAFKAKNTFDRKIDSFIEECKNDSLRKQIEQKHEALTYNAENVKKLESIGKGLFK